MRVTTDEKKLAEPLSNEDICRQRYGAQMSRVICRRLNELHAASSLEDMRNLGRCHELKGEWKGCFAVDLVHPYRMLFKPNNEPMEYLEGRTIVWKKVSSVEILSIEDYH